MIFQFINRIKNSSFFKEYKNTILIITIYFLCFGVFFYNKWYIFGNDAMFQYRIFYKRWIDIVVQFIKTGKINSFCFDMFLGTDFLSSMGYYCTGDIFLPILLLFRNNIDIGLLVETILCVYISGLLFHKLLKQINIKNDCVKSFISLFYAVSGQVLFFVQYYNFHRFYAFFPLLIIGANELFIKNRKTILIVAVAILFLQNYYLMYPSLIFLFLYCVTYCISEHHNFKIAAQFFIKFVISIFVGFLISCAIVLPSMFFILGNVISRSYDTFSLFWNAKTSIGLLTSIFSINPVGSFSSLFGNLGDYHSTQFNLFVTLLPITYFIAGFKSSNYNEKCFQYLTLLLMFFMLLEPVCFIMHGLTFPSLRWIFVVEFMVLLQSAKNMEKNKNINKALIINNIIFVVLLICILLLNRNDITNYYKHMFYLIFTIICNILISIVYIKNKRGGIYISIIFVLLSNILYFYPIATNNPDTSVLYSSEIDYKQNYDSKYYRYYLPYENTYHAIPLDLNSSLLYKIMTTSTYSSCFDTTIKPFLSKFPDLSNTWAIEIRDPDLLTTLGVKYCIIRNSSNIGDYVHNYDWVYSLSENEDYPYDVYENMDYIGFGYCASSVKYFDEFVGNSEEMKNCVFIDDSNIKIEQYINLDRIPLSIVTMDNNYLNAKIDLTSSNVLFIPIPNNPGWKVNVNGKDTNTISVNGGFIGIQLDKGYNNIEMRYSTPYLKVSLGLSILGLITFAYILKREIRQ